MTSINGYRQPPPQHHHTQAPVASRMPTIGDSFAAIRLIRWWAWIPIIVIMGPVMAWSSVSIFHAVVMLGVPEWCAWIPAAALDGVMLLMTPWAVNELLDEEIRQWAKGIVAGAIFGSVAVGFIDHYFGSTSPDLLHKCLAGMVGAVPNLIAALVVHVLNKMVRQQTRQRREQEQQRLKAEAELAEASRDLTTIRGIRAAERDERDELAREREEGHKNTLAQRAGHRQELHDAEVADATRLQQALQQETVEAATRSQQEAQQACDTAAAAHATAVEQQRAADAELAALDETLGKIDTRRREIAQGQQELADEQEALDTARREFERQRSRQRRRNNTTTGATAVAAVSQPPLQQRPTVSQPLSQTSSQPASRDERREWARQQIVSGEWERENGRELRGADIDNRFGPPRTGAAILREIKAAMDAELEAITSGG